ncbi:MAG: putative quinol monooxygenase [Anaerolineaceae bacterium]
MYIVHVFIHVKPEYIEAFKEVTMENARQSVKEPGVARFDVIQQINDPSRFVLVEVYRSEAAPDQHKETKHYNAWKELAEGMMLEPRTRIAYKNIFPAEDGW